MTSSATRWERSPSALEENGVSESPSEEGTRAHAGAPVGFLGLVRRAQAGERSAMDEIVTLLRPGLESVGRLYGRRLRPAQSADDLLQESCLRAWENLDQFQPGRHDEDTFRMFRGWMARIVRTLGMNAHRDQSARGRSPSGSLLSLDVCHASHPGGGGAGALSSSIPAPADTVLADELIYEITDALDDLADDLGERIVRMRFLEGLSLPAIASRLGLTSHKVRYSYDVTLRRLGTLLAEWK